MRAKRSLGQNFLVDPNIQRRIVAALEPEPGDVVVEIGPGRGALTGHLAGAVARLIALELDDELAAALAARYADRPDVSIVHGDALELGPAEIGVRGSEAKVIGNIPYNITTPLLFRLLERDWRPRCMVIMIQREVADRILAPPGEKAYGALSVGVRAVADVERVLQVGRRAFRPTPNVDSTVLRISPLRPAPLDEREEADLRQLTRSAFGQRRKQLQKVLRTAPEYGLAPREVEALERETGLDLARRPETLAPPTLIDLSRVLRARGYPRRGGAAEPGG